VLLERAFVLEEYDFVATPFLHCLSEKPGEIG
jgi:hypothetical protein